MKKRSLTESIDEKSEVNNYSTSDKIKIIQQLRLMGTQISKELADKLEAENN